MATSDSTAVAKPLVTPYQLDLHQTTQACKVLLRHITEENQRREAATSKPNLLKADVDSDEEEDNQGDPAPVWLILTTKKHIVDQKRLKPNKIPLPHPLPVAPASTICLITADTTTPYTDLISSPQFPTALRQRITRVISLSKLKSNYTQYEARRQLFAEHDIFLADDRIVTYLPNLLGKVFYKSGAKRPIPVFISAPQKRDEVTGKRTKRDPAEELKARDLQNKEERARGVGSAEAIAKEIEKALSCALIHLAPGVSTAVKVGVVGMMPEDVAGNVEAVVNGMTQKFVTKGWRNVRALHVKGPETVAFPVWLASELWVEEEDVKDEKPAFGKTKKKMKGINGSSGKGVLVQGETKAIEAAALADSAAKEEPRPKKRKADTAPLPSSKVADEKDVKHAKKKRKAEAGEKLAKDTVARKERIKKQKLEALSAV